MIRAEHLKKNYTVKAGKGFFKKRELIEAVADITLEIEKGMIVGLLGINGAGKTTTIKMLTALLSPTAGTYHMDGLDGVRYPGEIKKRINMIAGGERMIYWRLTAYENLWYYGQLYNVDNEVLKVRIKELLELVGLSEKQDVPVETFSKGMKQRLQIARGLINDPEYLFLDEPTIGLDAVVSKELRSHIKYLARDKKKGILLTSHYMGEVEELCDYIYIVNKGTVIRQGTAKVLAENTFKQRNYIMKLHNEKEDTRIKLQSYMQRIDQGAVISGRDKEYNISSQINLSLEISRFCAGEDLFLKEMYEKEHKLEDTIIQLSREV